MHHALFECMIDPETKEYLSEDFGFCRRWRALGGKIWLDVEGAPSPTPAPMISPAIPSLRLRQERTNRQNVRATLASPRPHGGSLERFHLLQRNGLPVISVT